MATNSCHDALQFKSPTRPRSTPDETASILPADFQTIRLADCRIIEPARGFSNLRKRITGRKRDAVRANLEDRSEQRLGRTVLAVVMSEF
jgi:hypothetical protein